MAAGLIGRAHMRGNKTTLIRWLEFHVERNAVDLAELIGAIALGVQHELAIERDVLEWPCEWIEAEAVAGLHVVTIALLRRELAEITLEQDALHDGVGIVGRRRC